MVQNTRFEEIYRMFLNSIQDYSIRNLFVENVSVADDLLETFLIRGLSQFKNCVKNIKDIDTENKSFFVRLDLEEMSIIVQLMLLSWMDFTINDITQMNLNLNDNDFKHFSEERNLAAKSEYNDRLREKVHQDMLEYGLSHTPFKKWAVGIYDL